MNANDTVTQATPQGMGFPSRRQLTLAEVAKREVAAARKTWDAANWNSLTTEEGGGVKAMSEDRARRAQIAYLTALLEGPQTTRQVAEALDRQLNTTGRAMRGYANAGLVSVDLRTTGSIYTITDAGREWLEANA